MESPVDSVAAERRCLRHIKRVCRRYIPCRIAHFGDSVRLTVTLDLLRLKWGQVRTEIGQIDFPVETLGCEPATHLNADRHRNPLIDLSDENEELVKPERQFTQPDPVHALARDVHCRPADRRRSFQECQPQRSDRIRR